MPFDREETIKFIQKNDAFYAKLNLYRLNDECLELIKKEIELEKNLPKKNSKNHKRGDFNA